MAMECNGINWEIKCSIGVAVFDSHVRWVYLNLGAEYEILWSITVRCAERWAIESCVAASREYLTKGHGWSIKCW